MLPVLRLLFALLTVLALGWQLSIHIGMGFSVANFFSYFTNLVESLRGRGAVFRHSLCRPRRLESFRPAPGGVGGEYDRGRPSFSRWYPYPFLNPASVGGSGVAVHAVGIAVTFIFSGWILLAAANRLGVAAAAMRNAGES